jgi:hypothetical protein
MRCHRPDPALGSPSLIPLNRVALSSVAQIPHPDGTIALCREAVRGAPHCGLDRRRGGRPKTETVCSAHIPPARENDPRFRDIRQGLPIQAYQNPTFLCLQVSMIVPPTVSHRQRTLAKSSRGTPVSVNFHIDSGRRQLQAASEVRTPYLQVQPNSRWQGQTPGHERSPTGKRETRPGHCARGGNRNAPFSFLPPLYNDHFLRMPPKVHEAPDASSETQQGLKKGRGTAFRSDHCQSCCSRSYRADQTSRQRSCGVAASVVGSFGVPRRARLETRTVSFPFRTPL